MQWAEEGEKPSIFFINLETNIFKNKTIPKLVNESGNVITDQNQITNFPKLFQKNLKNSLVKPSDPLNSA
jgi:hypothetical protein